MVAVPGVWPVTTPTASTLARAGAPLLHTPPAVASESAVVVPGHTEYVPVIDPAVGSALTVTTAVVAAVPQPFVTVYDIVEVPADMPVTTPVALTVATPVATELHTPPGFPVGSLSAVVTVGHTVSVPTMAPAFGGVFTVTVAVA